MLGKRVGRIESFSFGVVVGLVVCSELEGVGLFGI